jgi:hypothetical protein
VNLKSRKIHENLERKYIWAVFHAMDIFNPGFWLKFLDLDGKIKKT